MIISSPVHTAAGATRPRSGESGITIAVSGARSTHISTGGFVVGVVATAAGVVPIVVGVESWAGTVSSALVAVDSSTTGPGAVLFGVVVALGSGLSNGAGVGTSDLARSSTTSPPRTRHAVAPPTSQ
jgi:hypothetical protein